MPLIATLSRDPKVRLALAQPEGARLSVASSASIEGFARLVRERPVTCGIVDSGCIPGGRDPVGAVVDVMGAFPSLGLILLARRDLDPYVLFRLGRAGLGSLVLVGVDALAEEVPGACARALRKGTGALVTAALSPYVPRRAVEALGVCLHGVQMGWGAEEAAGAMGLSRPHLSVLLKAAGLPSVGHLMVWCRLLHAGRWLRDPGRTAESVSRQLEYSSGAAFRRALKGYVGGTPTEVRRAGGLNRVLGRFLERHPVDRGRLARDFAA